MRLPTDGLQIDGSIAPGGRQPFSRGLGSILITAKRNPSETRDRA
jgi:hypothetical protein